MRHLTSCCRQTQCVSCSLRTETSTYGAGKPHLIWVFESVFSFLLHHTEASGLSQYGVSLFCSATVVVHLALEGWANECVKSQKHKHGKIENRRRLTIPSLHMGVQVLNVSGRPHTSLNVFCFFSPSSTSRLLSDPNRTKCLCCFNCQESCLFLCGNQATRLLSWESTTAAKKKKKKKKNTSSKVVYSSYFPG